MFREFISLSLYYFLFFTLIGDYVIFLPKYLSNFLTPFQIGFVFAMMPIARFIGPFLFLKRAITKKIFLLAIITSTLFSTLILTHNFYLISISMFFIGISFSIIFPYIEAIAVEKLSTKYGQTRLFGSLGFMLFGILASYIKIDIPFSFIIFLVLSNLIALTFLDNIEVKKEHKSIDFKKEFRFWLSVILLQISFGAFYNFFTIYLLNHNLQKEYIGWLWAIGVSAEIVVFLTQHLFLNRLSPIQWMKISLLLTAIRWFILYYFANNLILIALSQTIHAFSFAIFHTAAILYLSQKYENKILAQQFFSGISYGIAAFLGSILSGIIYSDYMFLYESFISFLGFLIL